jgi:glycosyltransferase involved in cell wall biosynthesis
VIAAYDVRPMADGDLYGLDVAFGVFKRLAEGDSPLRLLVFLAKSPRQQEARRYLHARLHSLTADARERTSIKVGDDLTEIFDGQVIYLRPTRRDGDAVSVREALAFGAPTVASDIVRRPPGTRLVSGHDVGVWTAAVAEVLHQPPMPGELNAANTLIPGADAIVPAVLSLYVSHTHRTVGERVS